MQGISSRRPSPAMVLAFVALLAALSGTAVALPGKKSVKKDDLATSSVGKRAIAKGGVGASEAGKNSVGPSELKTNAVRGNDVNEGTLAEVPNATNADTAANAANASSLGGTPAAAYARNVEIVRPGGFTLFLSTSPRTSTITCPAGKTVIGGGGVLSSEDSDVAIHDSFPNAAGTGWTVEAAEGTATADTWGLRAYAVCATTG